MHADVSDPDKAIRPLVAWITVATLFVAQIVSTIDPGMLAPVIGAAGRNLR
jgi:hypothetical protein